VSSDYIPVELRRRVAEQARYRCGYCLTQEVVIGRAMEFDHLVPRSLGGVTVFNPRQQEWADHFVWAEGATRIDGRTAMGRATVAALQLNRPSLVLARKLWVAAGWHPPQD